MGDRVPRRGGRRTGSIVPRRSLIACMLEELLEADHVTSVDEEGLGGKHEDDVIYLASDENVDEDDARAQSQYESSGGVSPEAQRPALSRLSGSMEGSDAPTPDATRFIEADYLPTLREVVHDIVTRQGPLPVSRLDREVALAHGWQRTGRRIMQQVRKAMTGTAARDEFGEMFVWIHGETIDRMPFRGLKDRPIFEVSRTEIASVLDELNN